MAAVFDELNAINVNDKTEKKKSGSTELTYLSWTWAWAEVKKRFPDAHYEIVMHNGLPYVYDENTGYMVFTNVTIDGITHMMWLPVMDGANKTMKKEPYKYMVGKGERAFEKSVEAISMFDINKTIMRCLTKNIAMFGLGLYIYAGEDLPIEIGEPCTAEQIAKMRELQINEVNVCKKFKVQSIEELSHQQANFVINTKLKAIETKGDN